MTVKRLLTDQEKRGIRGGAGDELPDPPSPPGFVPPPPTP